MSTRPYVVWASGPDEHYLRWVAAYGSEERAVARARTELEETASGKRPMGALDTMVTGPEGTICRLTIRPDSIIRDITAKDTL